MLSGEEKTYFLSRFIFKCTILPRQAWDKHWRNSTKSPFFLGAKQWAFVLPPPPPARALNASSGGSSSGSVEQQQQQQQQQQEEEREQQRRQQQQQRAFLYEDRAHQSFAGDLFKPDFR